jgi:hypothetical protein
VTGTKPARAFLPVFSFFFVSQAGVSEYPVPARIIPLDSFFLFRYNAREEDRESLPAAEHKKPTRSQTDTQPSIKSLRLSV